MDFIVMQLGGGRHQMCTFYLHCFIYFFSYRVVECELFLPGQIPGVSEQPPGVAAGPPAV